jgi:WD40 repeat protein
METEEVLYDLKGHEYCIESIAFDADGRVLASASIDSIRLWDAQNGELLANMAVPDIWDAHSVAFSPDGTLLATAGYGDVLRLWSVSKPSADTKGSAPDTTIETSTIQASAFGEDFKPGQWSPDGRFVYYTDQGPIDEPGTDQAYQALTFLDAHNGKTCASVKEIVNLSYNPWSETMIPEGPVINERAFWTNDNHLLYLSPDAELLGITPCSDSLEDLTTTLPESIKAFYYGENFDHSQLLLKGETGTWLFTPSTGQSVKVAIPESTPDEEIHFAWSPWESKLASSRVESGDKGLKIVIENIDPVTGASEIIAEFPVVNEGYGWGHSISAYVSWTAKDQLFLHYLDNGHEKEKLIDLGSQPPEITHVFTDLFGIEPPSIDPGLSLFGDTGTTGEEDYYLSLGTGFSPDAQLYLFSAKTGLVETYPLDSPKLLIIPVGDLLFGETYNETLEYMPLQITQIETDRPPYNLEINGEIPGQYKHGKVILVDDNQHLLVASDQEISLIDIESGETLQTWVLDNHDQYDDFLLNPSPDGRAVIIFGIQIDENEAWWSSHHRAIFLLNLDD